MGERGGRARVDGEEGREEGEEEGGRGACLRCVVGTAAGEGEEGKVRPSAQLLEAGTGKVHRGEGESMGNVPRQGKEGVEGRDAALHVEQVGMEGKTRILTHGSDDCGKTLRSDAAQMRCACHILHQGSRSLRLQAAKARSSDDHRNASPDRQSWPREHHRHLRDNQSLHPAEGRPTQLQSLEATNRKRCGPSLAGSEGDQLSRIDPWDNCDLLLWKTYSGMT